MKRHDDSFDPTQAYDEFKFSLYCDEIESQYQKIDEEGCFEVFNWLVLDKLHSDQALIEAIEHFKEQSGWIKKDAPSDFLSEREKRILHQNGTFRPALYSMFLLFHFARAIETQSVFLAEPLVLSIDSVAFDGADGETIH